MLYIGMLNNKSRPHEHEHGTVSTLAPVVSRPMASGESSLELSTASDSSDRSESGAAVSSDDNSVTGCSVMLADFCGWRCKLWLALQAVGRVALSVSRAGAELLPVARGLDAASRRAGPEAGAGEGD